jgi:hypothetical protein
MRGGAIKLGIAVIGINLLFAYIGLYFLPQSESHPPKELKIQEGVTSDELIQIGEQILFGKGQCMVCHPMKAEPGMRAPAIDTIGKHMTEEAKERNMKPEDYAFEALVNPGAYVEKGYDNIMPPVHKPPTSLSEGELIALTAFLQSKGGRVTVSYPASLEALRAQIARAEKGGK